MRPAKPARQVVPGDVLLVNEAGTGPRPMTVLSVEEVEETVTPRTYTRNVIEVRLRGADGREVTKHYGGFKAVILADVP